jgi:hypothetical protein
MTVSELIEQLRMHRGDLEVRFAHPSHDYWRTTLAGEIRLVQEDVITPSPYHGDNASKIVSYDEIPADTDKTVVIIR